MKKNKNPIIISIVILLFVTFGILVRLNNSNDIENKTVEQWSKDIKNDVVVTVIGLTTCGHCQEYKPEIISLAKRNGFNLYFFEVDSLSEEDAKILTETYDLSDYKERVPFTFVMDHGKYSSGITGFSNIDDITEFLKENKAIKN